MFLATTVKRTFPLCDVNIEISSELLLRAFLTLSLASLRDLFAFSFSDFNALPMALSYAMTTVLGSWGNLIKQSRRLSGELSSALKTTLAGSSLILLHENLIFV